MKVLTAAQMREVDRRTIEQGIPGLVLMENAGHRVVEFLEKRYAPLSRHRIVVFCGKGNNGGDGFVVARQLLTRFRPARLDVVLAAAPRELSGDAAASYRMWRFVGGACSAVVLPEMRSATLVLDALLGTGIKGPAAGPYADLIREINTEFPLADVVAVDIPSGMPSDGPMTEGTCVRAAATVTFTAPKVGQVVGPNYEHCGELVVGGIGSPRELYDDVKLNLAEPADFARLFAPRARNANKGMYGHAVVFAGAPGKTGAAAMAGIAALRTGAGLVTVGSDPSAIAVIAGHAPELMTEAVVDAGAALRVAERKSVVGMGPGLGTGDAASELVRTVFERFDGPAVIDADGLNILAKTEFRGPGPFRVLTPHPGEMSRLAGISAGEVQRDRIACAQRFAMERNVCVVLKGDRTVIAFADGRSWINPTGSPSMATGGTGDILTGMITGLMAQFPNEPDKAVIGAVWLHGRAGEIAARELGEKTVIATDLLRYLPEAMREIPVGE